jgi:hypothetical protein
MDIKCKFIKYFKEPDEKYNCISISLFYLEKYTKTTKNLISYNATEKKINLFYENLLKIDEFLQNGIYPKDFYVRFYYDKSILKVAKYIEILKIFKKNKKIQLVEYDWDYFKLNREFHIYLIGTFARFYSIFDTSSKNMQYCVLADADNIFTKNFFSIFDEFKKTNNLIYTINSSIQTIFHGNDFMNNNLYNYIYLPACMTIIKRDKIFNIKYWNKYFIKMYEQNDLMYLYNYNDFKKYSFIKILGRDDLKIESTYEFCYGTDEIWLNYILKKILINNKKINKLSVYYTADCNFNIILFKLNDLFKFNNITNNNFKLFLKECNFIKTKNYDSLSLYIKSFENRNNKEKDLIIFFNEIKKNKYYKRIYIQNNVRYAIDNIEGLLKKRGKYELNEIMSSKRFYKN